MAKRGRKPLDYQKYTDSIVEALDGGATVKDACASVNLSTETFYVWCREYSDFADAITQAQAAARARAVEVIRKALVGMESETHHAEMLEETRFRKVKVKVPTLDKDGKEVGSHLEIVEQPYTFKKSRTYKTVTSVPPDWRAAVEYLKRRDKQNWSERHEIAIEGGLTPEQVNRLVRAIQSSNLTPGDAFEELIREFEQANSADRPGTAAGEGE